MKGGTCLYELPISSEISLDEEVRAADAFSSPKEVLNDPNLSVNEKRAILASWASDICAVEAMPELRRSRAGATASFDDIMDALKSLDEQARQGVVRPPHYKKWVRHSDVL